MGPRPYFCGTFFANFEQAMLAASVASARKRRRPHGTLSAAGRREDRTIVSAASTKMAAPIQ
jgi:hypothetical protein